MEYGLLTLIEQFIARCDQRLDHSVLTRTRKLCKLRIAFLEGPRLKVPFHVLNVRPYLTQREADFVLSCDIL